MKNINTTLVALSLLTVSSLAMADQDGTSQSAQVTNTESKALQITT